MSAKKFLLSSAQIKSLVPSMGWCLATDRVLVDGCRIAYMYRETPAAGGDSGWRSFAGDEDDEYMQNNGNHGVYDVNTVANYDRSVIPYLNASFGSRFDRTEDDRFVLLP